MINIRVLFAGPVGDLNKSMVFNDVKSYEGTGIKISFSANKYGPTMCASELDDALAAATLPYAARYAEKEGANAIVIESGGDTALIGCREAVSIPVVGLSDVSIRLAQMLGRKFGVITAGVWHGYSLERIMHKYGVYSDQYVGFRDVGLKPYLTDKKSDMELALNIAILSEELILQGADTILLAGSYFMGKGSAVTKVFESKNYPDITFIEQLPVAIRFARFLVESKLSHNKKIYPTPQELSPTIGYPKELFDFTL